MNALVTGFFYSSLAERIGWALMHFLWQGMAVALLLALALQFLRRASAQARWVASCAAFGLMVLLPVATTCIVSVDVPSIPTLSEALPEEAMPVAAVSGLADASTSLGPSTMPVDNSTGPGVSADELPGAASGAGIMAHWLQRAEHSVRPILPWAFLGWLVGVMVMSLWHIGGWLQLWRIRTRDTVPAGQATRETFGRLLQRLRISRPVRLLESERVAVPMVVGWLRPVVLLPASAITGLTAQQLEAVLAHELAHIRRYDCLVKLIQAVVETLLFYHPAVWWVSGRIRQESEHYSDELAVEVCGDRRTYAKALARVAELGSRKPHLAAAANGGEILSRIRRVVGVRVQGEATSSRWLAGLIALGAILSLTAGLHLSALRAETSSAQPPRTNDEVAWGEAVEGVQMSLQPTKAIYKAEETPEFRVALRNVGNADLTLNLGIMLANGKKQYPTAIRLLITDGSGKKRELRLMGPPGVAGRMDDFIVSLPAGSTYGLRVGLKDYWCPDTKEFSIELDDGQYGIAAMYEGKGAQAVNLDMEGVRLMDFWTGKVTSRTATFRIVANEKDAKEELAAKAAARLKAEAAKAGVPTWGEAVEGAEKALQEP